MSAAAGPTPSPVPALPAGPAAPPTPANDASVGDAPSSGRLRTAAFVVLTVLAVALRVQFALHAGVLWRDEVNSVNLVSVPTIRELMANLEFDSFPLLWLLVLRYWTALFGSTDVSVRVLGAAMSVLLPAALWWTTRQFKARPGVSLVFCGVAPAFVIWAGVANRGYGLGTALLTLAIGCAWRAYERPGGRSRGLLLLATLAAMHTLFYNALLLAVTLGLLVLMTARRRRWADVAWLCGIGLAGAASMGIYADAIRGAARWNGLVMGPIDFPWIMSRLSETLAEGGALVPVLFGVAVLGALGWAVLAWRHRRQRPETVPPDRAELLLFAGTLAPLAFVAQVAFLLKLNYYTAPWYYVTLIVVLCLCVDAVLAVVPQTSAARVRTDASLLLAGLLCAVPAWTAVTRRQTNLDAVARTLQQQAGPDDMILLYPWYYGVSFDRYYHGPTPWTSLPGVPFHRWHRYDLVKAQFADSRGQIPLLKQMATTLRAGHRVWVIGALPPGGTKFPALPPLPPADAPKVAWREGPWDFAWGQQAVYVLRSVGVNVTPVRTADGPVNEMENPPLFRVDPVGPAAIGSPTTQAAPAN